MLKLDTGGRLDMGLGSGSRPPEEVRFAIDSALERAGFEPSVPRLRWAPVHPGAHDATRRHREFHIKNPGLRAGVSTWRSRLPLGNHCLIARLRLRRSRGTEGSNPAPSTGESAANLTTPKRPLDAPWRACASDFHCRDPEPSQLILSPPTAR